MGARKSPMMAGFQAEENLTGRAPKKCAKNSGRYPVDIEDAEDILDQMNAYWDTITELMDPEIRKAIHGDLGPCSRADFLAEYLRRAHNDIVIG